MLRNVAFILLFGSLAGACSPARSRIPADLPPAPTPSPADEVARWVGELLSPDAAASEAAGRALAHLDEAHKKALVEQARRIPAERDPRWRNALDENGLLPDAPPADRIDLLLWLASRDSPVLVVRAQNGLLEVARKDPALLLERLSRPGPGRDAIAVALAAAGETRAVPALLDVYRGPSSAVERRAAAISLARLAGNDLAPRADGTDEERAKDADRLLAWYREKGGQADAR